MLMLKDTLPEREAELLAPLLTPGARIAWDTFQTVLGVESHRALGVMLALQRNGYGRLYMETFVGEAGALLSVGRNPFDAGLPSAAVDWLWEDRTRTLDQVHHAVEFEVGDD